LKNWFANKFGFTPKQVDEMQEKDIEAFLVMEDQRDNKGEREKTKREHLAKQGGIRRV